MRANLWVSRISFPESATEMCSATLRLSPVFLERGTASNMLTAMESSLPEFSINTVLQQLLVGCGGLKRVYICFTADLAGTNRRLKMEVYWRTPLYSPDNRRFPSSPEATGLYFLVCGEFEGALGSTGGPAHRGVQLGHCVGRQVFTGVYG
jgi:hypothetical protein